MYHWESTSIWILLGFGLCILVSVVTYTSMKTSILDGLDYETMLDLFGLNIAVLVIASFTDWGWVLYLVIPGILCYKCGGVLLSWADRSGKGAEETDTDDKSQKRRERRQVKYIR